MPPWDPVIISCVDKQKNSSAATEGISNHTVLEKGDDLLARLPVSKWSHPAVSREGFLLNCRLFQRVGGWIHRRMRRCGWEISLVNQSTFGFQRAVEIKRWKEMACLRLAIPKRCQQLSVVSLLNQFNQESRDWTSVLVTHVFVIHEMKCSLPVMCRGLTGAWTLLPPTPVFCDLRQATNRRFIVLLGGLQWLLGSASLPGWRQTTDYCFIQISKLCVCRRAGKQNKTMASNL